MMILVTRASDDDAQASDTPAATPTNADLRKSGFMSFSLVHFAFWHCGTTGCVESRLEQPRLLVVGVLAQHEAIPDESVDGADHRAVILAEARIALLDRR